MSQLKRSRVLVLLVLILSGCNNVSINERAKYISTSIFEVGEIKDFSSNVNRPVNDIENIGRNLYKNIKKFQKIGIDTSFLEIDNETYYAIVLNSQNKKGKVIFHYNEELNIFQIEGFVGFRE